MARTTCVAVLLVLLATLHIAAAADKRVPLRAVLVSNALPRRLAAVNYPVPDPKSPKDPKDPADKDAGYWATLSGGSDSSDGGDAATTSEMKQGTPQASSTGP